MKGRLDIEWRGVEVSVDSVMLSFCLVVANPVNVAVELYRWIKAPKTTQGYNSGLVTDAEKDAWLTVNGDFIKPDFSSPVEIGDALQYGVNVPVRQYEYPQNYENDSWDWETDQIWNPQEIPPTQPLDYDPDACLGSCCVKEVDLTE